MNILMLTNTYKPHVGGVARSVEAFAREFRQRGHRVLIIAPVLEGSPAAEADVIRVPAIQHFNGSDFSVRLPIPGYVSRALQDFQPEIVHSHHPFLLGDTALRIAAGWNVPLVFQHHTRYERYTHYVPGNSPTLQRFAVDFATEYANLCDRIIAPSESLASMLRQRGVRTPITTIPTGVDIEQFGHGDGRQFRRQLGIPPEAFVVGHVGRLAPEKNLAFLARAVAAFLRKYRRAYFMVVGSGPSEEEINRILAARGLSNRLRVAGVRVGQELADAYHAMDVFAFASKSETQGMVLTEAMAAGVPVVALDACGVREVVGDKRNGRLIGAERVREFAWALGWIAGCNESRRASLGNAARRTAREFAMSGCAERMLDTYRSAIDSSRGVPLCESELEASLWRSTLRRIEAEWELWSARAHATRTALTGKYRRKIPFFGSLFARLKQLRRALSRPEFAMRLLGVSQSLGTAVEPGLVLIQIDGLSRSQLEDALRHGRMPFLRHLLDRRPYRLHTLYTGMPSSTPAIQSELFYGIKGAVPSFGFRDHETQRPVLMWEADSAAKVQRRLAIQGQGLLDGGAAYSDIFSGGAAESHFCPATMGWGHLARTFHPLTLALLTLLHAWSVVRIAGLLVVEFVLAMVDFFRGLIVGQHLWQELRFVSTRVGICILLRELVTIGAAIDTARGLGIIHLNFLGYDEQSHRRGPHSAFAHWSLKGIDGAIRRVCRAARRSSRRDYRVWVYSDHGQEKTIPYPVATGRTLQAAVRAVFEEIDVAPPRPDARVRDGIQYQRSRWLGGGRLWRMLFGRIPPHATDEGRESKKVLVTGQGPIGHVYPPYPLNAEHRDHVAKRLVREAEIPLVLAAEGDARALAWTAEGRFCLPDDAATILGADHPFLEEVTQDLIALCHHPDAGPLILSGWTPQGRCISFPMMENGAHGGPGPQETRGFALLPINAPLPHLKHDYLRPMDLRRAVLRALGRAPKSRRWRRDRRTQPDTIRVLTYNVHSCIGTDGKLSPARVARLIARCNPDIVALQELDVGRIRTGEVDQAHVIAHQLQMHYHFHPAMQVAEEQYGDAVLSRFPMRLIRAAALPGMDHRPWQEPRGALWVAIDADGKEVQLLNTHLGLSARERMVQVEALLDDEWLGNPQLDRPLILCGDFNSRPRSRVHRRLCRQLEDTQLQNHHDRPKPTFPSRYPLGRIDHVFVTRQLEVVHIEVPDSRLARVASDHLPLLVELRIKK